MAKLVLGRAPEELIVQLGVGAFTTSLRSQDDEGAAVNWPTGAALRLELTRTGWSQSWPFTISGAIASLVILANQVALIPERSVVAHLWLNYGDGEFLWCSGSVVRSA